MNHPNRIVIIGARSAIAEQCARLWATRSPRELVLVGRQLPRLEAIAADLKVRSPDSEIRCLTADFQDPAAIDALIRQLDADAGIDIALVAHGMLPDQQQCEQDLAAASEALQVNAVSPVLFAEALARVMEARGRGRLAVIGSVAGDRGRKSNYVYGAAKGLVDRYLQGLQHRLAGTDVKALLIKPGPTDTPMTAHLKQTGARLASAEEVARDIVQAVDAGKTVLYTPRKWALIMTVIRGLPAFVFNKLNI